MPKAREQFAEFLDQDSLARFGILYQTTSVGFGYGRPPASRRSFSRQHGITGFGPQDPHHRASPHMHPGFAWDAGHTLGHGKPPPRPATPLRHSTRSNGQKPVREYQPVHPFDYACRPRLRTRLTRGRRTWPRNPWSSSGGDPHPALATHVCILTPHKSTTAHAMRFDPVGTLSYPTTKHCCRVFGGVLEPRYIVGAGPLDQ